MSYFDDGNSKLASISMADQYRGRPEGMKRHAQNDHIGVDHRFSEPGL